MDKTAIIILVAFGLYAIGTVYIFWEWGVAVILPLVALGIVAQLIDVKAERDKIREYRKK